MIYCSVHLVKHWALSLYSHKLHTHTHTQIDIYIYIDIYNSIEAKGLHQLSVVFTEILPAIFSNETTVVRWAVRLLFWNPNLNTAVSKEILQQMWVCSDVNTCLFALCKKIFSDPVFRLNTEINKMNLRI